MHLVLAMEDILHAPAKCGSTHVIAIDGRAGSGKTTLAHELFLALTHDRSVTVIHLDEVYDGWENALDASLTQSLHGLLVDLSEDKPHWLPIYNWSTKSFDSSKEILPCDLLILEGVGSGQKIVREYASASVWLDVEADIGLQRVLLRDGESIVENMVQWQIDEDAFFARDKTRENADFILTTT